MSNEPQEIGLQLQAKSISFLLFSFCNEAMTREWMMFPEGIDNFFTCQKIEARGKKFRFSTSYQHILSPLIPWQNEEKSNLASKNVISKSFCLFFAKNSSFSRHK